MSTPQMGPPPDVTAAVPDVNRSTKERVLGGIGGVLSAGSGQDPASSPLQKEMQRQHDIRLATARRHYENATTYGGILGTGETDPQTGEPTGINPQTGQPLTPEERAQYKAMLEGAWGDYEKATGVSKEAKGTLQKHRALLDLLVNKGHAALQAVLGAHQQATQAVGGGQQQPGGMTPPPTPGGGTATASAAATPAAAPTASGGPTSLPPPPAPPAYNPQSAAQAPTLRQGMADQRTIKMEQAKSDIEQKRQIAVEQERPSPASKNNVFVAMTPEERDGFFASAAPPNMTPEEQSVWKAATDDAAVSGKLTAVTRAATDIMKHRDTKQRTDERVDEFKKTDAYRTWKAKLDDDTKKSLGALRDSKAPAGMFQTAEFASGGLQALGDATAAMKRLEDKGVLGSLPANKVEDWIFGKGLVDPTLDAETRKDIGVLRSSMNLAGSAMLRAHTGRTSREIYDDFKNMLGPGQDWSALRGAMEESRGMLQHYAEGASDEAIKNVRQGKVTPPPSPSTWKAPADAPPAPKEDGHKLKEGNKVIAVSKGGVWASPSTP